jgi:hypothetical protein
MYVRLHSHPGFMRRNTLALLRSARADVVVVAIPQNLVSLDEEAEEDLTAEFEKKEQEYETRIDLRHWLKAEVMKLGRPIQ